MGTKEKVKALPATPGVYIMKDGSGHVLYVGKAGNLKKRVSSYFYPRRNLNERLQMLVSQIVDIEYIPASTEAEALIYENSLIKELKPKYNVALRDDKSYPMLKLTIAEKFPRIFITRQKDNDGAAYYGPYANAKLLREAVIILKAIFPLRSCSRMAKRPCLNFHIGQCLAPCAGLASESSYGEIVSELKLFLSGRKAELLKVLSQKMAEASRKEDFEKAAEFKRRIEALEHIKKDSVSYKPAGEVEELRKVLRLDKPIDVIEAFDVSNIMGAEAVGSMVYFYKGRPKKSEYRKFKINTVTGIDDYAMMREIVHRRYASLASEKRRAPDLILIDGGKGHLSVAVDELKDLGLSAIPAIGIAKEFEHLYVVGRKDPVVLPKESKALHLLERIRDEAHRFAITYHKHLLSKLVERSALDEIAGVGKKRKRALLKEFGSAEGVRRAGFEGLVNVEGMNEKTAQNIINYFKVDRVGGTGAVD